MPMRNGLPTNKYRHPLTPTSTRNSENRNSLSPVTIHRSCNYDMIYVCGTLKFRVKKARLYSKVPEILRENAEELLQVRKLLAEVILLCNL